MSMKFLRKSRVDGARVALGLIFLGLVQGVASGLGMQDPGQDLAFLEFEPYPSFEGPPGNNVSHERFWRLAGQSAFPAGKIGNHQFFGSFKTTLIDRDIVYDNQVLNDGILKRFWLSGGATLVNSPTQSSVFLAGLGVNSDFADIGLMDFNTEWIYIHSFILSPTFNWGVGLDIQQYFHKYEPYPLIFVDWKVTDRTKLKWDADYLEVRQFLTPLLCFTLGARFNLEFFALKQDASYEYQSGGLETGFQYSMGRNLYLRLKYKELVWGTETYGLPDGTTHKVSIGDGVGIGRGRSMRLNVAYGI